MAAKKPPSGQPGGEGPFTLGEVRELVEILEGTDVRSLVWSRGAEKVVIRRGPMPVTQVVTAAAPAPVAVGQQPAPPPAPAPAAIPDSPPPAAALPGTPAEKPGHVVTSPLVGTFYRAPSPESPAFVDVGSPVKKGQVLCIIEAMKIMNEIESDAEGKVAEIYALNATPVEFGEKLFRIELP